MSYLALRNNSIRFAFLALSFAAICNAQDRPPSTPTQAKPTSTPAPRKQPTELQKAVQEFRVQINQINSQNGPTSGKQNALNGRIYEYFRNDALDSVPHEVRQRSGTKSLLRRNQFGFNLNGPVRLPWIYDGRAKTFFSVSYEGNIERIAQSYLFTVPTALQQSGDFSDLVDTAGQPVRIYDPATTRPNPKYDPNRPVDEGNLQYLRDPFPNNVIPLTRLDPVARKLIAYYAKPNAAVGPFQQNNYFINNPNGNRANGLIAKLDHRVSAKHQFTLSMSFSRGERISPELFSGPANPGQPSYDYDNRSASIQHTWTVSPHSLLVFTLGASRNYVTSQTSTGNAEDYPGAIGLTGLFSRVFPTFRFGGYLGIGPRQNSVFRESNYAVNPSVALSLTRKSHTLRFTQIFRRNFENIYSPYAPAGVFTFSSSITSLPGIVNTGNPFASFLLGLVNRGDESIVLHPSYYRRNVGNFVVSDEYRIRSRVTATFAVNVEVASPRVEKYNRQSTLALDRINPADGSMGAMIYAGHDGIGRGLQPTTIRPQPSVGLTLSPFSNQKTVVRMGYSLGYQSYPLYGGHFATQGYNSAAVFLAENDQLNTAFDLAGGVPRNFPAPPQLTPGAANGTNADYLDPSGALPSVHQWSTTLQQELPGAISVEVTYAGWVGMDLFTGSIYRPNAVPIENLRYGDLLYTRAFRDSLRPYPQFQNFTLGGVYPAGTAKSNAMTATLDKRLTRGLFARVSYRLAKQIDNVSVGSAQDPQNLDVEMTLSPGDVTHSLQASYTYEFPVGRGKRWLNSGDLLDKALGGWSVSGLTSWRGGTPLIIHPLFNRTGGIVPNLHVNIVPGVDPKVANPSVDRWFNPDAFSQPDDFTIGNASYTHPTLRTPWVQFHHLSLTKRLEVFADKSAELVLEAFNFLNHANLNNPDTAIGPASSPNLNAGRIIGSTGGRVLQIGLRILF